MTLSKQELNIIVDHFIRDFDYGVRGTWGDGENYNNEVERKKGEAIVKKLESLGYGR